MPEQNAEKSYILDAISQKITKDGIVDINEATLLFKMASKDDCLSNEEDFGELYIKGITSFILNGDDSPGTLSAPQFVWLQEHISEDHNYTELESALLKNIVAKATKLPPNFYEWISHLETHLQDFGGDLDTLEYKQRTSFFTELKGLLAKYFPKEEN